MHRTGLTHLMFAALALWLPATVVVAENQPRTATADEIAGWIRDLDADSYATRTIATDRLIESGASATAPLANALPGSSREFVHRAIHVLDRLARSKDPSVAEAARTALEHAATNLSGPAASGASHVLSEIDRWRQQHALIRLQELGAKVQFRELLNTRAFAPVLVDRNRLIIDGNWKGKSDDLKLLRMLTSLQDLQFEGRRFTDADLQHVATVRRLDSITLKRTNVTDAGLACLAEIPELRHATFLYTPITDQAITHLEVLPSLEKLVVIGTEMSRAVVEQLEPRLGEDNVRFHRGAFLGVEGGQGIADGCPVVQTTEGSAAKKAGIKARDVILAVDDKKVDSFETLKSLLSDRRAGDKVKFDIRRQGKTFTKEITLGEWN